MRICYLLLAFLVTTATVAEAGHISAWWRDGAPSYRGEVWDESSGLTWLPLNVLTRADPWWQGFSYNDMVDGGMLGYLGFRYATKTEVTGLFDSFAIPLGDNATSVLNLLGVTGRDEINGTSTRSTYGMLAPEPGSTLPLTTGLSVTTWWEYGPPRETFYIRNFRTVSSLDFSGNGVGHWLVRDPWVVPEPASGALLAVAALFALGTSRRWRRG